MRTFIAIEVQEEMRQYLQEVQQQAMALCKSGNWTPEQNFHLTMHFLGEIDAEDTEDAAQAIWEAARGQRPFSIRLSETGFFARGQNGVFWAGIEKSKPLERLFFRLEQALERNGFAKEKKGLTAHITLGRQVVPKGSFRQVQEQITLEKREIPVTGLVLMESVRRGPKLIYRPIWRCALGKDDNEK